MAFDPMEVRGFVSALELAQAKMATAAATALRNRVEANRRRVISQQTARSGGTAPVLEAMVVDRQRGGSLASIKADSTVLLDWNYLREAAITTRDDLRKKGPEGRGKHRGTWKRGIVVMYRGSEIAPEALPPDARECAVVASVIYARMLEVGKNAAGGPFSVKGHGLLEARTMHLRRRLSNIAHVRFGYMDLANAPDISAVAQRRTRLTRGGVRKLGSRRKGETKVRYPAIFLTEIRG